MSSDRKVFIKYISYYIKRLDPYVSESEWKNFLTDRFGPNVDKASDEKLKNTALTLYYAHFAGISACMGGMNIIRVLKTHTKILEFFISSEKNRKKYGLGGIPIVNYTKESDVIEHMKNFEGPISVVTEVMMSPQEKKSLEKSLKEKSKSTKSAISSDCSKYTITELKKMAAERSIVGRSKMNKAELCRQLGIDGQTASKSKDSPKKKAPKSKDSPKKKASKSKKSCSDYTIKELKKMAAERSIVGRSKMNKAELCKQLGLA